MRIRLTSVVATIVAGVTLACSDAAVEQITAPPLAATPAQPVLNTYPGIWEYASHGIPSAIGMRISTTPAWENDYRTFTVWADVDFEWANFVTANVNTSLSDKTGRVVNTGSAGVTYSRFLLPVFQGDTTFVVRLATRGETCGLMGQHSYSGASRQMAVNISFMQLSIWGHDIHPTTGMDILQPLCVEAPPPPPGCEQPATRMVPGGPAALWTDEGCIPAPPNGSGGAGDPIEVCYTIWREYWYYDYMTKRSYMVARYPIGTYCYEVNMS